MARMHHRLGLVAALAFTTLTTGCAVSQEKYNALKLDRDRLAEQLGAAQNEAGRAKSESDLLKQQLAAIGQGGSGKDAMILNLTTQNAGENAAIARAITRPTDAGRSFRSSSTDGTGSCKCLIMTIVGDSAVNGTCPTNIS